MWRRPAIASPYDFICQVYMMPACMCNHKHCGCWQDDAPGKALLTGQDKCLLRLCTDVSAWPSSLRMQDRQLFTPLTWRSSGIHQPCLTASFPLDPTRQGGLAAAGCFQQLIGALAAALLPQLHLSASASPGALASLLPDQVATCPRSLVVLSGRAQRRSSGGCLVPAAARQRDCCRAPPRALTATWRPRSLKARASRCVKRCCSPTLQRLPEIHVSKGPVWACRAGFKDAHLGSVVPLPRAPWQPHCLPWCSLLLRIPCPASTPPAGPGLGSGQQSGLWTGPAGGWVQPHRPLVSPSNAWGAACCQLAGWKLSRIVALTATAALPCPEQSPPSACRLRPYVHASPLAHHLCCCHDPSDLEAALQLFVFMCRAMPQVGGGGRQGGAGAGGAGAGGRGEGWVSPDSSCSSVLQQQALLPFWASLRP